MIELAVFLPVLFAITMGTIETCRMLYLRQSLKIAAYECARLGIVPDVKAEDLQSQCDAILLGRGLNGYEFSCTPSNLSNLKYGEFLTTTASIPAQESTLLGSWFYQGKVFTESVTIMAEY